MMLLAFMFVALFAVAPYPANVWIAAGGVATMTLMIVVMYFPTRRD